MAPDLSRGKTPDRTELWSPITRPFVKKKHLLTQEKSISSLQSKEIDLFAVLPAIKGPELTPYLVSAIFSGDKSKELCLNGLTRQERNNLTRLRGKSP